MDISSLPETPRMPVLFIGHGIPLNATADNGFTRALAKCNKAALAQTTAVAHTLEDQ